MRVLRGVEAGISDVPAAAALAGKIEVLDGKSDVLDGKVDVPETGREVLDASSAVPDGSTDVLCARAMTELGIATVPSPMLST
jgi:hypothetical protein